MRFVGLRDLRSKSTQVWKELAKGGEIIITSNGSPVGLLTKVTEENVEQNLAAIRQAKAMLAVSSLQEDSAAKNRRLTLKEINQEIRKVRRKRYA